jgi:23S rRNA pseudouridine955/2504/2580 synthase
LSCTAGRPLKEVLEGNLKYPNITLPRKDDSGKDPGTRTKEKGVNDMGQTFEVDKHQEGRRLDKVLRNRWPDLPLGALMRSFRKKRVRLDGKAARFDERVTEGQTVTVPWDDPAKEQGQAARQRDKRLPAIEIIYADGEVCVANKPWNLLTQPVKEGDDSAVGRVAGTLEWKDRAFSPTAAHRLDRNTSGVLLVALTGPALRALHRMWREHGMHKFYLAVVAGETEKEGIIRGKLEKDTSNNVVSAVKTGGRYSETRFTRLETDGTLSLVFLELVTGRPHQARVHMAEAGHPVIGDVKYGDRRMNAEWKRSGVNRPLLHARRIVFPKNAPSPLEHLAGKSFTAVPPEDFLSLLSARGWNLYGHRV